MNDKDWRELSVVEAATSAAVDVMGTGGTVGEDAAIEWIGVVALFVTGCVPPTPEKVSLLMLFLSCPL
jgi:hypothetical protein